MKVGSKYIKTFKFLFAFNFSAIKSTFELDNAVSLITISSYLKIVSIYLLNASSILFDLFYLKIKIK